MYRIVIDADSESPVEIWATSYELNYSNGGEVKGLCGLSPDSDTDRSWLAQKLRGM